MKKAISLILAMTMLLAIFVGCAPSEKSTGETTTAPTETTTAPTEAKKLLTDPLSDIIKRIYEIKPTDIMVGDMPVDLETEFSLNGYTGLSSAELILEAAASESMITAQAYSLVLVRVKDAENAKTVADQMAEGINPRKWVCVGADEMMVAGYGDVVMLIMLNSSYGSHAQEFVDAFQQVCGGELDFAEEKPAF